MSILARLKAVRQRCVGAQYLGMIPSGHFENMRDQFLEAAALIMEEHPATRSFKPQDYREGFDSPLNYHKRSVQCMIRDVDYFIEYITSLPEPSSPDIELREQGIFLAGKTFDALMMFSGIVAKAKKEVILVDGYVDEKVLGILRDKAQGVLCRVLMRPERLTPGFRVFVDAFKDQAGPLEIRTTDSFHDRFVILDGKSYYHFGASINQLGKRTFMYSRIEEPILQRRIMESIEAEWNK